MLINTKRDGGYAKATLRLFRAVLSGILAEAIDDGVIQVNVAMSAGGRHSKRADTACEAELLNGIRPPLLHLKSQRCWPGPANMKAARC